ncbi:MAG: hypothetical protein AAGE59_22375, partial [Cyanobacteria bacterium P01_F01_bin.86]
MLRVLIIADDLQQYERLKGALDADETVSVTAINLQQVNPKNLRVLRQADLILFEDSLSHAEHSLTEEPIASLKRTGLPIMVLPALGQSSSATQEPLVLNLTEQSVAQTGLAALLNKIRVYYLAELKENIRGFPTKSISNFNAESKSHYLQMSTDTSSSHRAVPSLQGNNTSKMLHTLSAIRRISDQLREPLSNMNLAIH